MIVSCHVPKTAGTTLGELLRRGFGRRLHLDYGDRVGWSGDEAEQWRRSRSSRRIPRRTRIIHGHFYASKHAATFPDALFVTIVRDPVARVISNYHYLRAHPEIQHPLVAEFRSADPTLEEWVTWPWARNLQSAVLDIPRDRLAVIGLTEQFERSVQLLDAVLGTSLATLDPPTPRNVSTEVADVGADTVDLIAELNEADMELYRYAVERFEHEAVA